MKKYFVPRRLAAGRAVKIVVVYASTTLPYKLVREFITPEAARNSRPQTVMNLGSNPHRGWVRLLNTAYAGMECDYNNWIPMSEYWLRRVVAEQMRLHPGAEADVLCISGLQGGVIMAPIDYETVRLGRIPDRFKTNHKIGVPKGKLP